MDYKGLQNMIGAKDATEMKSFLLGQLGIKPEEEGNEHSEEDRTER